MYFATSQLQPWSSRDMQRGQGGKKTGKIRQYILSSANPRSFQCLLQLLRTHISVFLMATIFHVQGIDNFQSHLFPQALPTVSCPTGSTRLYWAPMEPGTGAVSRIPAFAPPPQPLALQVAWFGVGGSRGQRLETYKLSCSFGGNSPSQNSFSKEKKSLKILFENKEHSEDSITADFANTRIEINLGGQGEDSVSEVLAVQA